MSPESVAKFTRLRELVEDHEEVCKAHPWVRRLGDELDRARNALDEMRDVLAPAVYEVQGAITLRNHAAEDRLKLSKAEGIVDGYFNPKPESHKP